MMAFSYLFQDNVDEKDNDKDNEKRQMHLFPSWHDGVFILNSRQAEGEMGLWGQGAIFDTTTSPAVTDNGEDKENDNDNWKDKWNNGKDKESGP